MASDNDSPSCSGSVIGLPALILTPIQNNGRHPENWTLPRECNMEKREPYDVCIIHFQILQRAESVEWNPLYLDCNVVDRVFLSHTRVDSGQLLFLIEKKIKREG